MHFEDVGFELIENFISEEQVNYLVTVLATQKLKPLKGGIRHIEQIVPEIDAFAKSALLLTLAEKYLKAAPFLVRAIYFEKNAENNWYVTWHQDKTVTVSQRFDDPTWGPWSQKSGTWHVQAPLELGGDDHYSRTSRPVVIELGAGTAIPSARHFGEELECPLIRINPSESYVGLHRDIAIPFGAKDALQAIFSVLHGAD